MSVHRVDVIRLGEITPHPNADTLGITKVLNGFTVVVRLTDWHEGDLAAYIQPDSIVDTSRPEFSFLGNKNRVRVKRLRGIYSQGLLIPAPAGSKEGDDVAELLSVSHYEPPAAFQIAGDAVAAPLVIAPKYDVENILRFADIMRNGERFVATEKIHGANARFTIHDDQVFVGSRSTWLKESPNNIYWKAFRKYPQIEEFLRRHARDGLQCVIYGEVYGQVQDLDYGVQNDVSFVAFDYLQNGMFASYEVFRPLMDKYLIPTPPIVLSGYWWPEKLVELQQLIEQDSLLSPTPQVCEGVVIRPVVERYDDQIGRVQVKLVSNRYLER